MRYTSAGAFRAALEARLLAQSRQTGLPLVRLRKTVVFDRLLARLLIAAEGRWILKGGLALDYRFGSKARTTRDMDLARQDDVDAATADFITAQQVRLDDYFIFSIERTDQLDALDDAAAVRYRVQAQLAGRPFETVLIDVGFSNAYRSEPETILGTNLLTFAEIGRIEVPVLPLPQHIAEKIHAYTRRYGRLGQPSGRVKDLIDLALIASISGSDGSYTTLIASELDTALHTTFRNRATHDLPAFLPPPPDDWKEPYEKLASDVGIKPDIEDGYRDAQALIDPILAASVEAAARWSPESRAWII